MFCLGKQKTNLFVFTIIQKEWKNKTIQKQVYTESKTREQWKIVKHKKRNQIKWLIFVSKEKRQKLKQPTTLINVAMFPASLSESVSVRLPLPALSLPICLFGWSKRPYTLRSATNRDSYIFSKCHLTSISPDTFTEEVFHVVTCECGLLHVGVESASWCHILSGSAGLIPIYIVYIHVISMPERSYMLLWQKGSKIWGKQSIVLLTLSGRR